MHNACLLSVVRSPNNSNKHIHKPSTKQPNNQTIIEVGSTLFWCILFRDSAHHSALRCCTHCKLNASAYTLFFQSKKNILPVFLWKLQLDLERRWNSIQPVGHSCPRFWYMRHSDYYACSAAYLSSLSLTLSLLPPFRCVSALCLSLCLLVFFSVLGRAATMSRGRRGTTTRYLGAWPLLTSLSLSLSRPHELFSH